MNIMVMNSGNSKTSEPQKIILKILDKTNLKRSANSFNQILGFSIHGKI